MKSAVTMSSKRVVIFHTSLLQIKYIVHIEEDGY